LLVLICLSCEKREFDVSPFVNQFALAAFTPWGKKDGVVTFGDAEASVTMITPSSAVAQTSSKDLRMRPLPPTNGTPRSESTPWTRRG
jgi:hypothetical protein